MRKWFLLLALFILSLSITNAQVTTYRLYDKPGNIQSASPQSVELSRFVLFNGRPTICFTLNKSDKTVYDGKRSEVFFPAEKTLPVERWYAFNIWLPNSFVVDNLPEIVAQWHATPDFDLGEDYRSPPIAIMIQNGTWQLDTRWASNAVNTNNSVSGRIVTDLGKVENEKWTQWIFHIVFSYKDDGLIELWKNGQKVYTKKGPNYYNDKIGPYLKFGIYKWDWLKTDIKTVTDKRVLYFGDVKLGDNHATINDFLNPN